jgi:hypothetical protein
LSVTVEYENPSFCKPRGEAIKACAGWIRILDAAENGICEVKRAGDQHGSERIKFGHYQLLNWL